MKYTQWGSVKDLLVYKKKAHIMLKFGVPQSLKIPPAGFSECIITKECLVCSVHDCYLLSLVRDPSRPSMPSPRTSGARSFTIFIWREEKGDFCFFVTLSHVLMSLESSPSIGQGNQAKITRSGNTRRQDRPTKMQANLALSFSQGHSKIHKDI